jgi:glucose/mannose-6-phosphate isomerase
MDKLIAGFPAQLEEAIQIGEAAKLSKPDREIAQVMVAGLGGSGIGGSLVAGLAVGELTVPMQVTKGYFLPRHADEQTLLIACSYSGNTEETIQVLEQGLERGCRIVCITTGGKLAEMAEANNLDLIIIPGGMPPRACLGYSMIQQLFVLRNEGLIGNSILKSMSDSAELLANESESIKEAAAALAKNLNGKIPIIYIEDSMEAVAVRFRQQLNENSKVLAWHHAIPEMNHNELVGWRDESDKLAVVFFRNDGDYDRNQQRMEINKSVMEAYTPHIFDVWSKGLNMTEQAMYLIHFGDWVSWYLAQERGMDAVEVKVIDYLKGELAKG